MMLARYLAVKFTWYIKVYTVSVYIQTNCLEGQPGSLGLALCNYTLRVIVEHYNFVSWTLESDKPQWESKSLVLNNCMTLD